MNNTIAAACVEIINQPQPDGLKFRYKSEKKYHGFIGGVANVVYEEDETYPKIKISNFIGKAQVRVFLVSDKKPYCIHYNNLIGPDVDNGVLVVNVGPETNMEATFKNIAIQHCKREHVRDELSMKIGRYSRNDAHIMPIREIMQSLYCDNPNKDNSELLKRLKELLNPKIVRICFMASLMDDQGKFTHTLPPVYSHPIQEGKPLRICDISAHSGTAAGGTDILMFCEKIKKDDIEIQFYLENIDGGGIIWEELGIFAPSQVHYQYGIRFKTPPFLPIIDGTIFKIPHNMIVKMRLRRKSTPEDVSQPSDFTYEPQENDQYKVGEKRSKVSDFLRMVEAPVPAITPANQGTAPHQQQDTNPPQPIVVYNNDAFLQQQQVHQTNVPFQQLLAGLQQTAQAPVPAITTANQGTVPHQQQYPNPPQPADGSYPWLPTQQHQHVSHNNDNAPLIDLHDQWINEAAYDTIPEPQLFL